MAGTSPSIIQHCQIDLLILLYIGLFPTLKLPPRPLRLPLCIISVKMVNYWCFYGNSYVSETGKYEDLRRIVLQRCESHSFRCIGTSVRLIEKPILSLCDFSWIERDDLAIPTLAPRAFVYPIKEHGEGRI